MSALTYLRQLYRQTIGGATPSGSASSTGDISQMVKYVAAGSVTTYASAKKVQNDGYKLFSAGGGVGISGGIGAYGTYVQITASTSEADYIIGISGRLNAQTSAMTFSIVIATGAGGAEVVKTTIPMIWAWTSDVGLSPGFVVLLPFPIAVASGTRIAVACKSSPDNQSLAVVDLLYIKQADLVAL
jgi:hypothetical protein